MIRSLTASALAVVALAAAASAEDPIVIETAGVDFSDPTQATAIYSQVVEAAETVCKEIYITEATHHIGYSERVRMAAACVEITLEETIGKAAEPALEAIYAGSSESTFAVASN